VIFKSYAKVNLALDILGQDKNGYHFIKTILQKIPLYDEISIEESTKNSVIFEGEEANLINPKKNTITSVIKQLKLLKKYKIIIKKNIPIGAGLGGGSSNAGTILRALNKIENLGFSSDKLREIGSNIGIDVPFFIEPGTALGEHYGEKITILPNIKLESFYKILIIPKERKKTKNMYKNLDLSLCGKQINKTNKMIEEIKSGNFNKTSELMHNDFGKTPKNQVLCGSGTAIFTISNNPFDLKELSQESPSRHILSLPQ